VGWRRRRWVRVKLGLTAPSRGSSGGRGTDAPRHDPACARSGVKLSGRAVMRTGDSPVRDPGQPSHAVEIEPRAEHRPGADDAPLREQGVVSPAEAAASPASPTMVGPTTTPARTSGGTTEHCPLTGVVSDDEACIVVAVDLVGLARSRNVALADGHTASAPAAVSNTSVGWLYRESRRLRPSILVSEVTPARTPARCPRRRAPGCSRCRRSRPRRFAACSRPRRPPRRPRQRPRAPRPPGRGLRR